MASSRRELTDLQKRLEYLEKEIGKDEARVSLREKIKAVEIRFLKLQNSVQDRDTEVERLDRDIREINNTSSYTNQQIDEFKGILLEIVDKVEDNSENSKVLTEDNSKCSRDLKNLKFEGRELQDSVESLRSDLNGLKSNRDTDFEERMRDSIQNSVGREVWIVEERMTRIYNQQIATMEDNNLKARRKMEESIQILRQLVIQLQREAEENVKDWKEAVAYQAQKNSELEKKIEALMTNFIKFSSLREGEKRELTSTGNSLSSMNAKNLGELCESLLSHDSKEDTDIKNLETDMPKPDNIKNIDKKSVQMNNDTECASPVPELEMSPDDVTESDSARATTWSTEGPKSSASIIDIQEDEIWSSDSEAEDITYDSEASGKNCDNSARELKPANNGRGTEDIDKIQSATTEENIEQASNDGSTSNEKNDIVSKESRDAAEERDQFQAEVCTTSGREGGGLRKQLTQQAVPPSSHSPLALQSGRPLMLPTGSRIIPSFPVVNSPPTRPMSGQSPPTQAAGSPLSYAFIPYHQPSPLHPSLGAAIIAGRYHAGHSGAPQLQFPGYQSPASSMGPHPSWYASAYHQQLQQQQQQQQQLAATAYQLAVQPSHPSTQQPVLAFPAPALTPGLHDPSSSKCEVIPALNISLPVFYLEPFKRGSFPTKGMMTPTLPKVTETEGNRFILDVNISRSYFETVRDHIPKMQQLCSVKEQPVLVKGSVPKEYIISFIGTADEIKQAYLLLHGSIAEYYNAAVRSA